MVYGHLKFSTRVFSVLSRSDMLTFLHQRSIIDSLVSGCSLREGIYFHIRPSSLQDPIITAIRPKIYSSLFIGLIFFRSDRPYIFNTIGCSKRSLRDSDPVLPVFLKVSITSYRYPRPSLAFRLTRVALFSPISILLFGTAINLRPSCHPSQFTQHGRTPDTDKSAF